MISYSSALAMIEEAGISHATFLTEDVPLMEAVGRVLASPVLSAEEIPSFENSAMDGFAVFAADTQGATLEAPIRLPVRGLIAAGDSIAAADSEWMGVGSSVEIMTGAPVPATGYDAVVRIEDVVVERSPHGQAKWITLSKPIASGENIREKGTDFKIGQKVISPGSRVLAEHVLACASLGVSRLKVKRKPRVAIVSTGSELVAPDVVPLPPGKIRNSTGPFLVAALQEYGVDAKYLGTVSDDPSVYRKILENALAEGIEIVISTGAVSMGKFDFVPEVLKDLGAKIRFHKVAVRPGKPLLFAELGFGERRAVFFGVPGNPVATTVGLRFFVGPYLRALLGLPSETPLNARLSSACKKKEGLVCFLTAQARFDAKGVDVEVISGQASYIVHKLLGGNCWAILPEDGSECSAGTEVKIVPFRGLTG